MDDISQLVNETGLCLPLAARLLRLIADSGASQREIVTALEIVDRLRHHLKASIVPQELSASWSGPSAGSGYDLS